MSSMPHTALQNELDRLAQERVALQKRERELDARMEELASEIERIRFKVPREPEPVGGLGGSLATVQDGSPVLLH